MQTIKVGFQDNQCNNQQICDLQYNFTAWLRYQRATSTYIFLLALKCKYSDDKTKLWKNKGENLKHFAGKKKLFLTAGIVKELCDKLARYFACASYRMTARTNFTFYKLGYSKAGMEKSMWWYRDKKEYRCWSQN